MSIEKLEEFARDGEQSENGLVILDGFPRYEKPARQWFNSLFNTFSNKINTLVDAVNELIANEPLGVGDLYLTVKSYATAQEVADYHGYGTWERFAEGRALVGAATASDAPTWTKTAQTVYGSYTHTLKESELPSSGFKLKESSHHTVREHGGGGTSYAGGDHKDIFKPVSSDISGWEDQPHNIVQPSIVINVWVRTL